MKTLTLIISSLLILMTTGLSAQQHGPQHHGQRGHMNPEEMIKRQVEHMKTELISRTTGFRNGQHEKAGRAAKPFSKENLDGRTI